MCIKFVLAALRVGRSDSFALFLPAVVAHRREFSQLFMFRKSNENSNEAA